MDHPDQVAGYVARTVLGEATPPVPLAAGAWSTAYALTVAGRAMVLRVSRYGGDFAKDEVVSVVVGGALPVPAVTARGETHGWAYAVSERLTGTALDDLDANDLAAVLPDPKPPAGTLDLLTLAARMATSTNPDTPIPGLAETAARTTPVPGRPECRVGPRIQPGAKHPAHDRWCAGLPLAGRYSRSRPALLRRSDNA